MLGSWLHSTPLTISCTSIWITVYHSLLVPPIVNIHRFDFTCSNPGNVWGGGSDPTSLSSISKHQDVKCQVLWESKVVALNWRGSKFCVPTLALPIGTSYLTWVLDSTPWRRLFLHPSNYHNIILWIDAWWCLPSSFLLFWNNLCLNLGSVCPPLLDVWMDRAYY